MKPFPGLGIIAGFLLAATGGISIAAEEIPQSVEEKKCDIFTPEFLEILPSEIAGFVERYLYQRLYEDTDTDVTKRRLDFDEVSFSFPLKQSSLELLRSADGLSIGMERGVKYTLQWLKDGNTVGEIHFPASFNLIMNTDQKKSFGWMSSRMHELAATTDLPDRFIGCVSELTKEPFLRHGKTFYLGHLTSDTYHDSSTGRPLWSMNYPAESLANLFILPDAVADVDVEVALKAYNGEIEKIRLPFHKFRKLMEETGCQPYFGVSEIDEKTGKVEALVVYYNPTLAFVHKIDVRVLPEQLWNADTGHKVIQAEMLPYVGLHNLNDLWGDR